MQGIETGLQIALRPDIEHLTKTSWYHCSITAVTQLAKSSEATFCCSVLQSFKFDCCLEWDMVVHYVTHVKCVSQQIRVSVPEELVSMSANRSEWN